MDFTNQRCQHIPITTNDSLTSPKHIEIPWQDAGCQATLEGTCQEKIQRARTKIQENVLAHGKKIGPVDAQ